eukprot:UN03472
MKEETLHTILQVNGFPLEAYIITVANLHFPQKNIFSKIILT